MTKHDATTQESAERTVEDKLKNLHTRLDDMGAALVAFSGGVDSSYLLKAAVDCLGDKVLAVTADSPSIPRDELAAAVKLAEQIGARHEIITTDEMQDADYLNNAPDRCYHCKKTLFDRLTRLAEERGIGCVIEGSNYSDLSDYRPGKRAVSEFAVRSPLREAGLTKDEIRRLSREAGLPTWDKPAAPCLSSRIPYGQVITPQKLSRIEKAERYLRTLGLREFRVRDHGEVARIEVEPGAMSSLIERDTATEIVETLKSYGYAYVALDLLGFRSGSLNEVLKDRSDE